MDAPSDEDAWGEFKSTTEQGDSVKVLSTTAAAATAASAGPDERDEDEPPPSVVHQQKQPEAEGPESAAGGKEEDGHAGIDAAALAAPATPHPAAELREESNETMAVKAAQSADQTPRRPDDDGNSGGGGVDLLYLLPSPTAAGDGVSRGGEDLDLFGSLLFAPAPEKLPAPNSKSGSDGGADADANATGVPVEVSHDDFRGASASPEGEKGDGGESGGEWGVFEQPGPAAPWDRRDEEGHPTPTPPTTTHAAEKVDGEWIDLVGTGSDSPGEEKEGRAAVEDEKGGGVGMAALGGEEDEQQPGEPLVVDLGRDDGGGGGLLVGSDASVSAAKPALGVAPPSADEKPDVKPGEEPHDPSDERPDEEMAPPSEGPSGEEDSNTLPESESLVAATPQGAEGGISDDMAGSAAVTVTATGAAVESAVPGRSAGVPVALSAAVPSVLEPSLPAVAVAGKPEGERDEGNVAGAGDGGSPLAVPEATGVATPDVLDWGDFGAPSSPAEATVDGAGAAAASPESAAGNGQEGQTKEEEEPSHSAAPDAADVAAVDVLDWDDFGSPSSPAEATVEDGAAAAASGGIVHGNEPEGPAKDDEEPHEEEEEDEWSAFEAPPTPSPAPNQEVLEPLPRSAGESMFSADFTPPADAAGEVQEDGGKDGRPESRAPTTAEEEGAEDSEGAVTSDAGKAGDTAGGAEDQQPSETVVPPSATPAVEWGDFGDEETSEPSPEEPSVGGAGGDDKTPPGDDKQALPSAMPELVGGPSEDAGGSWGAFDEAPPAAAGAAEAPAVLVAPPPPTDEVAIGSTGASASAAAETATAAQADEQANEEPAPSAVPPAAAAAAKEEEDFYAAAKQADAPPGAVGAEAEGNNTGGDQQSGESEDDWGSDFGDFEEAPTTDEPEPGASAGSTVAGTPAVVAFPKPPVSAARSLPAVGAAVGAGGAASAATAATVQGGIPPGITVDNISGDAGVPAGGGAKPSPLATMVAVFDGAFGGAVAAEEAVASWQVPSASGGAGEGGNSLDSLADLAHLLVHAKPSRRSAPARLSKWAESCILRGIRPVPDALPLQDDDSDQDAGHSGRGRRRGSVTVSVEAQSSTPAISSTRVLPVVEAQQPAAAERSASSPPASVGLARGSSGKASPRAVSPSSAPRPLPRKASATVETPPAEPAPVASPAVLGESAKTAGAKAATPRVVSPSSSPPPLPRKASPTVDSPPAEPAAGQTADASSDKSTGAVAATASVGAGQSGLEATSTAAATTPAAIELVGTSAFAAFPASPEPSGESAAFGEDDFVWSEAAAVTPEMPRHPPPRVPTTPPTGGGENRGCGDEEGSKVGGGTSAGDSGGDGDEGVPAVAAGGESAASAEADADDDGGGGDGDDDEWSDDPFDSFQSAPVASSLAPPPPPRLPEGPPLPAATAASPAGAAGRSSPPSPPPESSPWNLDFLMAAPATGGAGEGRVSPAPGAGFGEGVSAAGEGGQPGKPLDLVSQALAGFGIAAGAAPDTPHAKGGDDVFSAFSEGRGATGALSSSGNMQGGALSGGGGGLKGERDRDGSVDVSDLLRATRLRGGGRRASRPRGALSAAAEARLSALPDLSFMLSQRIRFPMRAADPLPAAATGEGFL